MGVSRNAPTPLIVDLSPGHGDRTRFRPWSPIATGNHLDRAEKNSKVAQTTGTVDFLIRVPSFRGPLRGKRPHIQMLLNNGTGPNPRT